MSRSESGSRIVAVCQSCDSVFVSEQLPGGTIRPIGVSADCTCGDGEFRRVTPSEDGQPEEPEGSVSDKYGPTPARPPSD